MLNTEDFIKRMEFIMEHFGLNASAFADKVNVQRSSISHLLSGRNKPSLEFVMKVIDLFPELNLYWFLDGKGSFLKENDEAIISNVEETASAPLPIKAIEKPLNLFNQQENKGGREMDFTASANLFSHKTNGKSIEKIVLLYTDGTFKEYKSSTPK